MTEKILVPVDFSPCSMAALDYALSLADACAAEVEILYVWSPDREQLDNAIFAETAQGVALEQLLSHAEQTHPARVSGRVEFGAEPDRVIMSLVEREHFDLVVLGRSGDGHVRGPAPSGPRAIDASVDVDASAIDASADETQTIGHVTVNVLRGARCRVVAFGPPPRTVVAA